MQKKMKALVYEGPREMNLREVEVPSPGRNEVLIEVAKAGICGSELGGYLGQNSLRKPPLVMGHEFSGTVASLGDEVTDFEVGDPVTANPLVSCGHCVYCKGGAAHLCAERELIGAHRPGAYAGYVLVPWENVYTLPEGLSLDRAALAEPFACAVHVCRLAEVSPADRMLVVGAGPIGLLTLITARIFGLENVVVTDLNKGRLEISYELGGVPANPGEELQSVTPEGGFEVVVDAVGADATRWQCVEAAKSGGRVIFSGLHEAESPIPVNLAIRNELRLQGSFGYSPEDFGLAVRWLGEGEADLSPWTKHVALEEGRDSFEMLLSDPGKVAKILLQT